MQLLGPGHLEEDYSITKFFLETMDSQVFLQTATDATDQNVKTRLNLPDLSGNSP